MDSDPTKMATVDPDPTKMATVDTDPTNMAKVDLDPEEGVNWLGILSIVIFYFLILGVGIWAARKKGGDGIDQEVTHHIKRRLLPLQIVRIQCLKRRFLRFVLVGYC